MAVQNTKKPIINRLLDAGADIEDRDDRKMTAALIAAPMWG